MTVEHIPNRLHHCQVILLVIQTQTLVTMMTITIKEADDGRGRKGGHPEHNAQRPLLPRDTSPHTRGILESLQQLSTPTGSMKNAAEPPSFLTVMITRMLGTD